MTVADNRPWYKKVHIVVWILLCACIGAGIGLILATTEASEEWGIWLGMFGRIWIRCLKLLVLPLVFCSVVVAVTGLDDIGIGASKIARNTVALYALTTLVAVGEGLAVTYALKPAWDNGTQDYFTVKPSNPTFTGGDRIDVTNSDFTEEWYNPVNAATMEFMMPGKTVKTVIPAADLVYYFEKTVSFSMPKSLDDMGRPLGGALTNIMVKKADGSVQFSLDDGAISVDDGTNSGGRNSISLSFEKLLDSIFPSNLVAIFYGGSESPDLLSMITFATMFAVGLVACRRKWNYESDTILLFFKQALEITMWLIQWIVGLTPFAVGSLILAAFASQSLSELSTAFSSLGVLIAGLVGAFLFHICVFLSALCFFITRFNPYKHIAGVFRAITVALGCASSAVTLPTTIICCEAMGMRPSVVRFVLSLGATVSMDGSAMYIPSAIIWLAAQANISLGFGQVIILAVTATLSSAGASPTPGTIPTLIMAWGTVFPGVAISETGIAYLSVADWFIDRCVTATNITGDSFMARIVDHFVSGDISSTGQVGGSEEAKEIKDVEDAYTGYPDQMMGQQIPPMASAGYSPYLPQGQPQYTMYQPPAQM